MLGYTGLTTLQQKENIRRTEPVFLKFQDLYHNIQQQITSK